MNTNQYQEQKKMPATLELTDGATTLDLLAPPYRASQPVRIGPPDATPVLAGQTPAGRPLLPASRGD